MELRGCDSPVDHGRIHFHDSDGSRQEGRRPRETLRVSLFGDFHCLSHVLDGCYVVFFAVSLCVFDDVFIDDRAVTLAHGPEWYDPECVCGF